MSKTLTISTSAVVDNIILGGEISVSAGKCLFIDETFSSEDVTIAAPIDVSALKAIFMLSDANLQVIYNEAGGPHDFFHGINAGVPWFWESSSGIPNPFGSADVASIQFNQVGASARIQIMILTDPTP